MTSTLMSTSVVEVEAGADSTWWTHEQQAVRAALVEHYGRELPGSELPEPADAAALRARLRTEAPRLTALTDRIRAEFDARACAVVVPALGVADGEVDQRRTALFVVAVMLGDVMANHPDPCVVWDVRNRQDGSGQRLRASSSDREAKYHTDAGYLGVPPRFFLLYAARAAACGGGVSMIRDGRQVLEQLAETEEGRAAVRVLRETTAPREVAENLWPWAEVGADGFQHSHLLGDLPMWRWTVGRTRRNATPEVAHAIGVVSRMVRKGAGEIRLTLPTDGLLVIDNHIALHARTAFTDPDRNLFRIRFHDITGVADRPADGGR